MEHLEYHPSAGIARILPLVDMQFGSRAAQLWQHQHAPLLLAGPNQQVLLQLTFGDRNLVVSPLELLAWLLHTATNAAVQSVATGKQIASMVISVPAGLHTAQHSLIKVCSC